MYSLLNATNLKKHYQLEWVEKIVRRFRSIAPKYNTGVVLTFGFSTLLMLPDPNSQLVGHSHQVCN